VDAHDLRARHGEETVRVVLAQVRLDHERQAAEIVERTNPVGIDPRCIEPPLVKRHAVIRPAHAPAEPLELKLTQLRPGHRLCVAVPDHLPNM
jgi:hypothetical protein